jgi:hypothetical protein
MQKDNKFGYYTFPNTGYYLGKVPSDIFSSIKKEVDDIQTDMEGASFAGHNLTGNIENEYDLINCKDQVEQYILSLLKEYDYNFNYLDSINQLNKNVPICLQNLWVNFQKKYEFNPNHNHSGVMSFVIWVKIPYNLKDEKELSPGKRSNSNQASLFQFSYTDILGSSRILDLPIDSSYEGVICMFPNHLMHCVYPFYTSDDYRISVSGNVYLDVGEK